MVCSSITHHIDHMDYYRILRIIYLNGFWKNFLSLKYFLSDLSLSCSRRSPNNPNPFFSNVDADGWWCDDRLAIRTTFVHVPYCGCVGRFWHRRSQICPVLRGLGGGPVVVRRCYAFVFLDAIVLRQLLFLRLFQIWFGGALRVVLRTTVEPFSLRCPLPTPLPAVVVGWQWWFVGYGGRWCLALVSVFDGWCLVPSCGFV